MCDEKTLELFGGQDINLVYRNDSDRYLNVDPVFSSYIAGALNSSTIEFYIDDGKACFEVSHPYLEKVATRIVEQVSGEYILVNNDLQLRKTGEEIGTRMLAHQAWCAQQIGISKIFTWAAAGRGDGNESYNGIYTWPLCGFDGEVDPFNKNNILNKYNVHINKFSDILAQHNCCELLSSLEFGRELQFDLAADSLSWEVLHDYQNIKGVAIIKKDFGAWLNPLSQLASKHVGRKSEAPSDA